MRKQSFATFLVGISIVFGCGLPASAQTAYKAQDIVKHFQPGVQGGGVTRSLGVSRGLCVGTEAECANAGQPAKPPAAFDLMVKFKYNSDVIEPEAKPNLDEFAKALRDPALGAAAFLVEGHTDATGSAGYNLNLSERRANAVVRYLREHGVSAAKLEPKGYGQTKPLVADPFSGDNRRVETRLR